MSLKVKGNPVIKIVSVVVIVGALSLMYSYSNGDKNKVKESGKKTTSYDTNNEELNRVNGYLDLVEQKANGVSKDLKTLKEGMITKEEVASIVSEALTNTPPTNISANINKEQIVESVVAQLKAELDDGKVSANEVGSVDDALAFEEPFDSDFSMGGFSTSTQPSEQSSAKWVHALGTQNESKQSASLLTNVSQGLTTLGTDYKYSNFVPEPGKDKTKKEEAKIPYGTIHRDSSIFGVTMLNAMIGRIAKKGTHKEPFEFSAILSGDTLMANGFSFPQIKNATISGYAIGDRAFSCARGFVTNITFIFNDGRIFQQSSNSEDKPIGSIADEWGNPCVKGIPVDDIEKFIAAQGITGGLAAYAGLVAAQQQTLYEGSGSVRSSLDGSAGKFTAGSIVGGGLNATVDILNDRYENYYEAMYVEPGRKVTLMLKENINIDYDPAGRKVSYEQASKNVASLYY